MNSTPNAQRPTLNVELATAALASNIKNRTANIIWRILDFVLAGIFIFAGLSKILDLDHLMADLQNLQFANALTDLRNLSLANPVAFASGIDNFKLLPWPMSIALAFYLPWLELAFGFGLFFGFLYGEP